MVDILDSILTIEDKEKLSRLKLKTLNAENIRIRILRKAAIKAGLAAKNLKNLKSVDGATFVEDQVWSQYKLAFAHRKDYSATEFAYLCASKYELMQGKDFSKNSCGWVKGEPEERKYNHLGPMSGSAGTKLYCIICNKELCKLESTIS